MASAHAAPSTAPAAPIWCPVIDLVDETATVRRVVAEDLRDGRGLGRVVQRRRRAVRVDVVDLARLGPRVLERPAHREHGARALRVRRRDVERVVARTRAGHLAVDPSAARLRVRPRSP